MEVQPKRFYLFNCDNTYDLKIVEDFLLEEDEKGKYKIHVDSLNFGLRRMTAIVETTLPVLPGVSNFFIKSPGLQVRPPNLPVKSNRGAFFFS